MPVPRAILLIVSGFVLLAVLFQVNLAFSSGPLESGVGLRRSGGRFSTAFAAGIPTFVIIEATPPEAQVFLDGQLLGVAKDLVARAFRVSREQHTVAVTAPGFRPYSTRFDIQPSFPTQLRIALAPE
jgi:hypothetical protein